MIDYMWMCMRADERNQLKPATLYREQWREYNEIEKLEAKLAAARDRADSRLRLLQQKV